MYLEIAMEMKGRFIVMAFLYPKNVHTCIIVYEHYEHTYGLLVHITYQRNI